VVHGGSPGDGAQGMDLNVQLVKALRGRSGMTCRSCSMPTGSGPAVRARMVPQSRAIPSLLRRRSGADVRPRSFIRLSRPRRFRSPPAVCVQALGS
jgi:hypothetical protein